MLSLTFLHKQASHIAKAMEVLKALLLLSPCVVHADWTVQVSMLCCNCEGTLLDKKAYVLPCSASKGARLWYCSTHLKPC